MEKGSEIYELRITHPVWIEERVEEYPTRETAEQAQLYYSMVGCCAMLRTYEDATEKLLSSEENRRRLLESRRRVKGIILEKVPTEHLERELESRKVAGKKLKVFKGSKLGLW